MIFNFQILYDFTSDLENFVNLETAAEEAALVHRYSDLGDSGRWHQAKHDVTRKTGAELAYRRCVTKENGVRRKTDGGANRKRKSRKFWRC